MKKLLLTISAVILSAALAGCGNNAAVDARSDVHTYRIAVFTIKEHPGGAIEKPDGDNSHKGLAEHLNYAGGNFDNILTCGYVEGICCYEDETVDKQEETQ